MELLRGSSGTLSHLKFNFATCNCEFTERLRSRIPTGNYTKTADRRMESLRYSQQTAPKRNNDS